MSTIDFFTTLGYEHLLGLFICIIVSAFIYYLFYHKLYVSVLDPFFISTILSLFGCSVVIFLFYYDAIKTKYAVSYLFTQLAFIAGVLCHKKRSLNSIKLRFKNELGLAKTAYIIIVCSVVLCQLVIYKNIGIPIFMDSRLEVAATGGGVGVLLRIIDVWGIIALFLSFYFLEKTKIYKSLSIFYIVFFIVVSILSGSKSNFWRLMTSLFMYAVLFSPKLLFKVKKNEFLFLSFGIIAAVLVIFISIGDDSLNSIVLLLERFVISGDVYWETYPNGYIELLNDNHPFESIFVDIITAYRIIPFKDMPEAMGIEIYRLHTQTDLLVGPNPRHNVMGYVYWGMYGSIFFSFLLGLIVGWVRQRFYSVQNGGKNIFPKIFIALCYNVIWGLESDVSYTIGRLHSIIIMSSFLIFILFLWSMFLYSCKNLISPCKVFKL